jgi:hypothetical protein
MSTTPLPAEGADRDARDARNSPYPDVRVARDLENCQRLVSFAAQHGKPIEGADTRAVVSALDAQRNRTWSAELESDFYAAMTHIAQAVAPVTAETLGQQVEREAGKTIGFYSIVTFLLASIVIALSCLLLVLNQFSDDIEKQIKDNDGIALLLHNELQAYVLAVLDSKSGVDGGGKQLVNSPGALVLKEHMQQFATNNRRLFSDADRLSSITSLLLFERRRTLDVWNRYGGGCNTALQPRMFSVFVETPNSFGFMLPWKLDGEPTNFWLCSADTIRTNLEITLPLLRVGSVNSDYLRLQPRPEIDVQEGFQKIAAYQDIRAIALLLRDTATGFGGAAVAFLLPVLYSLLGAYAYILRQLKARSADKTFHPQISKFANRAHIATALVVGITIGLFTNLLQGTKDASPLALAFIGGYGADKFFEFIERIVKAILPPDDAKKKR